ncbi:hypothetical protein GCM10010082_13740 [Kushneria pakistanensis]|uniref:Lipoprotein n=1 Tax=Kushneria pakistanensis TaxID=1508770 RepID=A0ABQ3FFX7_9GAMM|nr:hypothetical protein [Kushneria pakistanensis]GHC22858.1 hypothetical protein GCM10010082_13740 [Kushneria pakistanensis]
MKAHLCSFAILAALAGCTGEAPDHADDGLVFESGSYTHAIDKDCVDRIALEHDEASKPVVTVDLIDSPECSGALSEFTDTHVGDPMALRFDDEVLLHDANAASHPDNSFTVPVDSGEQGQAIVEYYQ